MRFKIRTLFLLTLIAAVLVVTAMRPYVDAASESAALKSLQKDWEILVDAEAFLGKTKGVPEMPGHWSHWPAKRLFGDESLKRIQKLRICSPKNAQPKLADLAAFDKVTHLEINQWVKQDVVLDANACKYIGKMASLHDLVIGPSLSNQLVDLTDLPLKKLSCRGRNWSQAQFEAIGAIQTLERVLSLIHI